MNRQQLRKMILQEFKMLPMSDLGSGGLSAMGLGKGGHHGHDAMMHSHGCDACGHSPCECDEYDDAGEGNYLNPVDMNHHQAHGSVSKEDCCKAVLCLIECCSCPETKALLKQCCDDILSRC
jgi:hypothetical protein